MNEIENISCSANGCVAQLDEHKPSKFADAGSNPVTVKIPFKFYMLERLLAKRLDVVQ